MKFAAANEEPGVVELSDDGSGDSGVVNVVTSLMPPTVVALPVIVPVTGIKVSFDGLDGGVPEGVLVSLRVQVDVPFQPAHVGREEGVIESGEE